MAESDIQEMQAPVLGKIESIFEYDPSQNQSYTLYCYIKDGKNFARQDKAPPGWFQTSEKGRIGFRPLLRTYKWHLGAIIGDDTLFLEYDKETKLMEKQLNWLAPK